MSRKIVDCRDMPSEVGCTLTLTGQEDEVVEAAAQHAVKVHGHADGSELREMIRGGLRDAAPDTAPGAFVQLIEFRSDDLNEFDAAVADWMRDIGPDRTARWFVVGGDREQPGRYVELVEFPSYEDAMANSEHPATAAIAKRLGALSGGDVSFRNLDVVRAQMS